MIQGRKIISVFLVLTVAAGLVMNVGATNVNSAKDKAQKLEQQKEEAKKEQQTVAARVKELSASMKQMEEKLEKKRNEIEKTDNELLLAQAEANDQYESMKLRIRYMYENENVDIIQLLLTSDSITDFLSKAEYITRMSEYDRDKLNEYQQTVHSVKEKELELQAEYRELESLQESLLSQQAEAKKLLAEKTTALNTLTSELKTVKAQIARAEEEARRQQEAQNADKNQGSNASNNKPSAPVVSGNGYFTHPCPGMTRQSSYFGEIRENVGNPNPHKGHDYAAPTGTPIYAAASGTVISAGYAGDAGYRVVINHGNGLVTRYMHMYKQPLVKAGQKVQKGQHIGGVGDTGRSTGPHLHFQVEEGGIPVNPSKYL